LKKLALSAALAVCLAGCAAPQQQTAIPPSTTGCYYRVPGLALYGVIPLTQPRYEAAPCNVINANAPMMQDGGSEPPPVPSPTLPPLPNATAELPALPQHQTQLCFGSGAFEQCQ
jgi:hypothetical protein